jgi:hypothetical protein
MIWFLTIRKQCNQPSQTTHTSVARAGRTVESGEDEGKTAVIDKVSDTQAGAEVGQETERLK